MRIKQIRRGSLRRRAEAKEQRSEDTESHALLANSNTKYTYNVYVFSLLQPTPTLRRKCLSRVRVRMSPAILAPLTYPLFVERCKM